MTPPEEPAGWTPPALPPPPEEPPSWAPPHPWEPPEPPRRRSPWLLAVAAAMVVAVALGGGIGIGWSLARVLTGQQASLLPNVRSGGGANTPGGQAEQGQSSTGSLSGAEAAVVDVNTTVTGGGQAAGSGMVLTSSGEVLTNNHVVSGATSLRVTVPATGRSYDANVIGVAPSSDVALIQLQGASRLKTVKIAPASAVHVGAAVVAIGNALGQGGAPSVTEGTITALDQAITATEDNGTSEQLSGLIESDAPISPGDSGGALVSSTGEVIGMVTAGQATRGFRSSTSDVGYAVPATTAMSIVNQIRSGQASDQVIIGSSGYIGVQVRDAESGVEVVGVESGSAAEQAGITSGSIITAINGTSVSDSQAMGQLIHRHKPGEQVTVSWTDSDGASHSASVTLQSGPPV